MCPGKLICILGLLNNVKILGTAAHWMFPLMEMNAITQAGLRMHYTDCIKKVGTMEYLEKYKFHKKMFPIKVVGFKRSINLINLISLILGGVAKVRAR